MIFRQLHQSAVDVITKDPYLNLKGSKYGKAIIVESKKLSNLTTSSLNDLKDRLFPIDKDFGKYKSWTVDREYLLGRYWQLNIDDEYFAKSQIMLSGVDITNVSVQEKLLAVYI